MTGVNLGPAGSTVLVDVDVCVKSGQPTRDRVTLRGQATPTWVTILLFVSIIGFLIADSMTSRRYRVTVPLSPAVYDRWRRNRRWAGVLVLFGVGALVLAATLTGDSATPAVASGLGLLAVAAVFFIVNAMRHGVGVQLTRDGDLMLTRVHPAFAEAVRTAVIEQPAAR